MICSTNLGLTKERVGPHFAWRRGLALTNKPAFGLQVQNAVGEFPGAQGLPPRRETDRFQTVAPYLGTWSLFATRFREDYSSSRWVGFFRYGIAPAARAFSFSQATPPVRHSGRPGSSGGGRSARRKMPAIFTVCAWDHPPSLWC